MKKKLDQDLVSSVAFQFRLTPEDAKRLKELALKEHRSVANWIKIRISETLKESP